MSMELHAYIAKSSVPDRETWQNAINRLGFSLELDESLKENEDSGYLPCKLNGEESGFEIYYEPPDEYIHEAPELREPIGTRDWCISFRWGGDMDELACVFMAAAALVTACDAVVHDPNEDEVLTGDFLIAETRDILKQQ